MISRFLGDVAPDRRDDHVVARPERAELLAPLRCHSAQVMEATEVAGIESQLRWGGRKDAAGHITLEVRVPVAVVITLASQRGLARGPGGRKMRV